MKIASASMPKAPGTGLVGLPAEELTGLLDDILAGDSAEEDAGQACLNDPAEPPPPPRTVEECFSRLHPLTTQLLGAETEGDEFTPLILDAAMEVPPAKQAEPEPAAEDEEPLVLDAAMEVAPADHEAPEPAAEDEEPLVLDAAMEVASADHDAPEPAAEDEEPLVLDAAMEVAPADHDAPEPAFDDAEPLLLDRAMEVPPSEQAAPEPASEDAEPLVLDSAMEVPPGELVAAAVRPAGGPVDDEFLAALPPYEPPPPGPDDPLLVADSRPEAEPEPIPEPEAESESTQIPAPGEDEDQDAIGAARLAARVEEILEASSDDFLGGDDSDSAFASETSKGTTDLPQDHAALAALLGDIPPGTDFEALDLLYACWPKTTARCQNRPLLAVATNLASTFGLPHRLPMAMSRAWHMLDPELFEDEVAARLAAIADFIFDWQREQQVFLILEFGEIELIEYLFEVLPPGNHLDLLAAVMNFKVLSNRRMGLLRRIPNRLRKQIQPLLPERKQEALALLAHAKALLETIGNPNGFPPIIEAAHKAREDVEKLMKQTANAGTPAPDGAPPGGGQPLGRIG